MYIVDFNMDIGIDRKLTESTRVSAQCRVDDKYAAGGQRR